MLQISPFSFLLQDQIIKSMLSEKPEGRPEASAVKQDLEKFYDNPLPKTEDISLKTVWFFFSAQKILSRPTKPQLVISRSYKNNTLWTNVVKCTTDVGVGALMQWWISVPAFVFSVTWNLVLLAWFRFVLNHWEFAPWPCLNRRAPPVICSALLSYCHLNHSLHTTSARIDHNKQKGV